MNLGNIFKRDNQNIRPADTVKVSDSMSRGERAYRIQSEIRSLVPGQTIQGSVVSRDGSSVQIALRQNMLISARIDQSISLALGQNMSFEVKANNGSVLSLTPLYANMANEPTVMRALDAAGLPETANNIEMVAVMMEEGMPIDKEALANISRFMMEFPAQNPATLVQMTRLGLPITEETIEQFDQYRQTNHQLVGSAEEIMNELPQIFRELAGEGRMDQAVAFYRNVLDIFLNRTQADAEGTAAVKQEAQAQTADGTAAAPEAPDGVKTAREAQAEGSAQQAQAENAAAQVKSGAAQTVIDMAGMRESAPASEEGRPALQESVLTDKQWNTLGSLLRDLGADEQTAQRVGNGEMSSGETLALIRSLLPRVDADDPHARLMARVLDSREFSALLREEMGKQWLIEPKDVADPHKVEQLYERVREQAMRLHEAMQEVGKADAPAARSVQNLQNNVDFMNQLNHMFTYVQLPLKLAGNNAHGDLYVYTNKKNLAAKDGSVSALLHLDMEHLGPLDVYVTMQQNRVNTNFTLQDESALDLIEEHIHLLDERLAGRGYDLKAQFSVKEEAREDEGILQTILSQGKNISVLSRTSFDMRA